MKDILKELEKKLAQFDAPVLKYFNPPMDNIAELNNFIRVNYSSDVEIPSELAEVYQWHNGTDYEHIENGMVKLGYFADELCLVPLSRITLEIQADETYGFIKNSLFPFCISFNGEMLCVQLNGEKELIYCSASDYEIPSLITMYDDLNSFFLTMTELYDANCFQIDDEWGIIALDTSKYDLYMSIGERMNPQSDYWRVKREFQEM